MDTVTNGERAASYGKMLRRTVRARRVLMSDVARAAGVSTSSMSDWCNGKKMPDMAYQVALADVLGSEHLLAYAKRLRTRTCRNCGSSFIDQGRQLKAVYCSPRCSKAEWSRRAKGRVDSAYKQDRAHLALHRECVAMFCHACEPAGLCLTPACDLRRVSPLPLVRTVTVGTVSPTTPKMAAYLARRYDAA
jgi:transcriptional regulator with XRE-family HTH domain